MNSLRAVVVMMVAVVLLAAAAPRVLAGVAAPAASRYVCPPCGVPCDTTVFAAPGVCPVCGMTLIEQGKATAMAAAQPPVTKVAIVVFDGAEILDFCGPYEMFGAAGYEVYAVAATTAPITTAMGLTVVPKFTFADAPQPDVLVIPGGSVEAAQRDSAVLAYIRAATAHTSATMSVCNGAFILARTGLLDGLTATTTNGNIPKLAAAFPGIHVVRDRRLIDNGRLITTAGLSAGMDGALHVIARLSGYGYAQRVALAEEYDWRPDRPFVRAALADTQLPQLTLDSWGTWDLVRTEGDTRQWRIVVRGRSTLSAADVMRHVEDMLTAAKWAKLGAGTVNRAGLDSEWRFAGRDGEPWRARLRLREVGASGQVLTVALSVRRLGVRPAHAGRANG